MPSKYTSKLQKKRVLVLGGTSGIGYCVAEGALEFGAHVIISGSRQEKIDATIERLLEDYPDAKDRLSGYPCDLVSDNAEENVVALLDFATKGGKLDHVVKTSGDTLALSNIENVTAEKFFHSQKVRLFGSVLVAKHLRKYINNSSASSYSITGGVNTYKPAPGWALQAATGAGADGLTRGLAVDLKPIRVNCVAPGAILTEIWGGVFKDPESQNKIKESFINRQLVKNLGKPEDTAEAYLYLMRDGFIDGQTILTEGGLLLA